MTGVRYREDTGFEGRCEYCRQWWPIDAEFWYPKHGVRRCKACWAVYHRLHEQGRNADEATREMKRTNARLRYHENRERNRAAQRAWKSKNKDRVREYQRQWRARNREKVNEYARSYYAEARDVIVLKKRRAYRGEEAA